jgi:hypothetical protein
MVANRNDSLPVIEPNWILLFSKKRGRWWVRLLACGRYNHVKAIAYLPALHTWLFYDVKFNGTRLMLIREDGRGSHAFLQNYLDSCDLVAMPRLPIPKRVAPQAGFWCTLAMKHLVGIRGASLRPDQLWRDSVAAGGKPYESELAEPPSVAAASMELLKPPRSFASVLSFMKAHAETSSNTSNQPSYMDDAAYGRQGSELIARLRARIRALHDKLRTGGRRGRPYCPASSRL